MRTGIFPDTDAFFDPMTTGVEKFPFASERIIEKMLAGGN